MKTLYRRNFAVIQRGKNLRTHISLSSLCDSWFRFALHPKVNYTQRCPNIITTALLRASRRFWSVFSIGTHILKNHGDWHRSQKLCNACSRPKAYTNIWQQRKFCKKPAVRTSMVQRHERYLDSHVWWAPGYTLWLSLERRGLWQ